MCIRDRPNKTGQDILNLGLRGFNEEHENEASWLGSCLQLPKDGMIKFLFQKKSINDIADHYHSSLEMTKYRLNISGAQMIYIRSRK